LSAYAYQEAVSLVLAYMMIDATIVRAHQHSAGAQKKTARRPSVDPAAD